MTTADVLIVGGGSCGSALAARLSDRPGLEVRLLEAGPAFGGAVPPDVLDPTVLPVGPASEWAWHYRVQLSADRTGDISRGRLLGGSGAVNGCYFVRARPEDFAAWPQTWSWDDVRPYFRRLETDHDFGGPLHGQKGPIPVRRQYDRELAPISAEFAAAAVALGFADEPDKNGDGPAGIGPVPLNIANGQRVSTASAYLADYRDRPNLHVDDETSVTRILFDGATAIGVEAEHRGEIVRHHAALVVLCAGAVESAALLMRSGIGDSDRLRAAGVEPIVERRGVGVGFADHPEIAIPYDLDEKYDDARRFVPLQVALNDADIEVRPYSTSFAAMVPGSDVPGRHLGIALMTPRSRGRIDLRSADPHAAPVIDFRYLSEPADRDALRRGVELARELLRQLESRNVVRGSFGVENLGTSQHMTGTCRMGSRDGELSVVDERCSVIGTEGLAVVDTSIIPAPVSRGVHATAVMLAERAADLLV